MDTTWISDFVVLARTLNFSRAAEERNVTQSAFSRRIRSLESWLGAPLIDRTHYPVKLTPAGREFLPTARTILAHMSEARQSVRAMTREALPMLRFAALHAVSVNFLQPWITAFEAATPELRTYVQSDTMASICQLLMDGGCDFLLCYRHEAVAPSIDETRFARKDVCEEALLPVAHHGAAARAGWTLGGRGNEQIPYLSYDPQSFLGVVVDHTIGERRPALDLRYVDALVEALKRRAVGGGGVAWLPERAIGDELEDGVLVRIGGASWATALTISVYCAPDRLDEMGQKVWAAF
ncbi:MAG: LysR family transcriptional regulator [Pseudomonadota bacterium]